MVFFLLLSVLSEVKGQPRSVEKQTLASVKAEVTNTNYKEVRIKKFPIASQCWTFRKFTFYETLEKAKELGIKYLQPFSLFQSFIERKLPEGPALGSDREFFYPHFLIIRARHCSLYRFQSPFFDAFDLSSGIRQDRDYE